MKSRKALQVTRRILLASGGVAAGVALFAASGETGMMASTKAPHPEGNSQAPSQYSEVVRLRFFAPDLDGSNWVKGVGEEIITEFYEYNDAAEVEVLPISSGDILNKLVAASAAGVPPDVSYADAHLPRELGAIEVALDITPYIYASWEIDVDDYWNGVAIDSVYRGHWFGLPWAPTVTTFFYNQDVFEEVSFGPIFVEPSLDPNRAPANWDELLAATTYTHRRNGEKTERLGFWYDNNSLAWWMVPYWQQGGQLLSEDELTSTLNNEKMVRAFALTRRLLDLQGGLDSMNAFKGAEGHEALIATGRCAMWTEAMDVVRSAKWAEKFAQINIGADTYPVAATGSPAAYRGGGAHIMPFHAEFPDHAFVFLEWLYMESNDRRFNDVRGSLPARRSVAHSPEYTKGDPLRLHSLHEMARAQSVVSGPGARAIFDIHERMASSIWKRDMTIAQGLEDGNAQVQQALDAALKDV